ncbi:hypothetical protein [Microbacterium sp. BH-3-3-3]|uniref:hypothetical protein n=1 Tax=Microbacterium sp. BH-3-3-3 TaxID=1906742 RepID=UPI0011A831FD|nr:hypothetical protein [Microbacterium sp. BH-3-3-3]
MTARHRMRSRLLAVGAFVASLVVLSGCVPATAGDGFDIGTATCDLSDTEGEAILRLPVTPYVFDRVTILDVSLLGHSGMQIRGILVLPDSSQDSFSDLDDRLRTAGTDPRQLSDTRRPGTSFLAVLLAREGTVRSGATAAGIRIGWTGGEPGYYQDVPLDIAFDSRCRVAESSASPDPATRG